VRYAISSSEEVWVRICSEFFQRHGTWDWYQVPRDQALREMMKASNGVTDPTELMRRIEMLYESVGAK
jgi:hypothetical protein